IPSGTRLLGVSVKDGVANVDLTSEYQSGGGSLSMQMRLGQVVYTLTQFPTVGRVRFALDGAPVNVFSSEGIVLDHPVGRADYQNLAAAPAPLAGSWQSLPPAPVRLQTNLASVWTGTEMLIYGVKGVAADGNFLHASNALAAYNPATNTWRKLAASPLAPSAAPTGAWDGREVIVLVGDFDPDGHRWPAHFARAAAYNPVTDTWRRIAPLPESRGGATATWDGH